MSPNPIILIDTGIVGGPGRGLFQLTKYLASKSLDYLLVTFKYSKPVSTEFVEEATKLGLKNVSLKQFFSFDPLVILNALRLIKQGKHNIIQSHGYKTHLIAFFLAKITGLPWIGFVHGWTNENRKVEFYHKLDRFFLRFADIVVTVSPSLHKIFSTIRGPERKTFLILNAVDNQSISGRGEMQLVRERCNCSPDEILLGCFGRLSFEKGQDRLVRAAAEIKLKYPRTKFLFLGNGPELDSLKNLSIELGVDDIVFFHPHSNAMRDYYEAIDLLVLPSRSEGLPNVVLEAMSFAVPVVATDVGAVPEVLTDSVNGWIVESSDGLSLVAPILHALSDSNLRQRIGKAGLDSLHEKFCPEARARKILELYSDAISEDLSNKNPRPDFQ